MARAINVSTPTLSRYIDLPPDLPVSMSTVVTISELYSQSITIMNGGIYVINVMDGYGYGFEYLYGQDIILSILKDNVDERTRGGVYLNCISLIKNGIKKNKNYYMSTKTAISLTMFTPLVLTLIAGDLYINWDGIKI
jgi:hypothetical protein